MPLVIDSVGQATWPGSIKVAQPAGRIVSFGATTGNVGEVDIRSVFSRQISIHGTMMGNAEEFAAMLKFYAEHRLRPVIHTSLPLSEAAEAHRIMEAEQQFGKIVLDIAELRINKPQMERISCYVVGANRIRPAAAPQQG